MNQLLHVIKVVFRLLASSKTLQSWNGSYLARATSLIALALLGHAASAAGSNVESFTIQGYVNFQSTLGPNVGDTFGITSGDAFTGTISYDPSQPANYPHGPGDPSLVGFSVLAPFISLSVRGQEFDLYSPSIFLSNPNGGGTAYNFTTDAGIHADPNTQVSSPWGNFVAGGGPGLSIGRFTMANSSGTGLSNGSLPSQLSISDWPDEHQIVLSHDFGASGGVDNGSFYLDAEITTIDSITAAPEPATLSLLALGSVSVIVARLYRRRRPE
jgi:hypothetical protein